MLTFLENMTSSAVLGHRVQIRGKFTQANIYFPEDLDKPFHKNELSAEVVGLNN